MNDERKEWKAVPVYKQSMEYAREHNELPLYEASAEANRSCKRMIEDEIKSGLVTKEKEHQAALRIFDMYGKERPMQLLANTLQKRINGHISQGNARWAEEYEILPDRSSAGFLCNDRNEWLVIDAHPSILNDLVTAAINAKSQCAESGEKQS